MKVERVQKLRESAEERFACIWSTVSVLVSSQVRALRLRSETPRQKDFAKAAGMQQSLISRYETPGANVTLETLAKIAAANSVALKVEFVPFSEMKEWEANFSQDLVNVTRLEDDFAILDPVAARAPTFAIRGLTAVCPLGELTSRFLNSVYSISEGGNQAHVARDFGPLYRPAVQRLSPGGMHVQDYLNAQKYAGTIAYTA